MLYNEQTMRKPFGAVREGEEITITFPCPTPKVQSVRLLVRNYYNDAKFIVNGERREQAFVFTFSLFKVDAYFYSFEVKNSEGVNYYGKDDSFGARIHSDKEWQITVYRKDYVAPTQMQGGIIYHIFVDRFCHSGKWIKPKCGVLKEWGHDVDVQIPFSDYRADDFFGGNLKGIISKLDYLAGLNVTTLYLSPIFQATSNHRYDTGDYTKLDPMIGSEEDFSELIRKAKKLGIGVILDGVFNHSGDDSLYFNKYGRYDSIGAFQSKDSPYYDWYVFDNFPSRYRSWWGCTVVPVFNKESKGYRNLLFGKDGVLEKWTKFGIEGWRLDVVDELPIEITDLIHDTVKRTNPQALIIGEVWEDASVKESYGTLKPYFTECQLDGVMNYPYMNAIIDYVIHCNTRLFVQRIMQLVNNYPFDCLLNSMIMLGSHDTRRILNVLSEVNIEGLSQLEKQHLFIHEKQLALAKKRLLVASVLAYTLPGVPSLYYGDEAGMRGERDPLNRLCYPWGNEDEALIAHYRNLGKLRAHFKEAMLSEIKFEQNDSMVVFTRGEQDNKITIVANSDKRYQELYFENPMVDLLKGEVFPKGRNVIEPIRAYFLQDLK